MMAQFFQSIKKVVKAELSDAIKKGYESFASAAANKKPTNRRHYKKGI